MDNSELGARLDRLERSNHRLRAIVTILAIILGFTTVVALWPAQAEAQGRAVSAQAFLLLDDVGRVRADLSVVNGQPRLMMWQPLTPGLGDSEAILYLGADDPALGGRTRLTLGDAAKGMIYVTTSQDGRQPSVAIFPPGAGTAVWSAP